MFWICSCEQNRFRLLQSGKDKKDKSCDEVKGLCCSTVGRPNSKMQNFCCWAFGQGPCLGRQEDSQSLLFWFCPQCSSPFREVSTLFQIQTPFAKLIIINKCTMFHVDTFYILKQKNRFGFTRCLGKPPATREDNNFEANFLYHIGKKNYFGWSRS